MPSNDIAPTKPKRGKRKPPPPASLANLKPAFKPGRSGNPAGSSAKMRARKSMRELLEAAGTMQVDELMTLVGVDEIPEHLAHLAKSEARPVLALQLIAESLLGVDKARAHLFSFEPKQVEIKMNNESEESELAARLQAIAERVEE